MKKHLWPFFLILALCSCKEQSTSEVGTAIDTNGSPYLFDQLNDSITNITFINSINENAVMNGFNYEYLYNGAGLSVGDFNGDGLTDVYFAANLVDNNLYLNKGNLKFLDVTEASGTAGSYGFHVGTTVVDINADGRLDIYICKSGAFDDPDQRRNELYVNQGNNKEGVPLFKEEAAKYKLDLPHYSTQAAFFDYDKDGDLDLFLINHNIDTKILSDFEKLRSVKSPLSSDRLFKNEQNKFIDVSDEAGLINDGIGFGLGLAVGDLNNDHWPDIIVGQDYYAKDRMYLNQRNGTFKEVINEASGHISTFSMGNDLADFNNDGWMDFMSVDMVSEDNYGIKASMSGMNPDQFNTLVTQGFHHQYMYNTLQMNNGVPANSSTPLFSDIAALAGVTSTDWSWGPLFFDMDLDGDKDLFVSNGIKRDFRNVDYIRYKQEQEKNYERKLKEAPESLKGLLREQFITEMLRRMPARKKENYFFENQHGTNFVKQNGSWVADQLTITNGAAYADLDNDGDLDIITNNMDETAFIYRNNSVELGLGNYLKIKLEGPSQNLDGIGARITLKTKNGIQVVEQYLTRGFQSSSDRILHFGLGNIETIPSMEIEWPDGLVQQLNAIESNQTLTLSHANAQAPLAKQSPEALLFEDITRATQIKHFAPENEFNDYARESLLPHKMSEEGPALAVGDVNNDGFEDFYVGGAKGFTGVLYLQNSTGQFSPTSQALFEKEKKYEDADAIFFDADQDNDLDLYVASGGNEFEIGSTYYEDRLYINQGGRFSKAESSLSDQLRTSSSVVRPHDFDGDGDLDLFVGGRQHPGKYPYPSTSTLLRNDSKAAEIQFTRIENDELKEIGMVTDAQWVDTDQDGVKELAVVGEWMTIKIFKNHKGQLTDWTQASGLNKQMGWWFSLRSADFDQDGDQDLVAGNLGLNSKYQTSIEEPFEIYVKDFDQTGTIDIVLGYHQAGKLFPVRGRECSSNQMPFIKEKFPSYHAFATAELEEVYGVEQIKSALNYEVSTFASTYFENNGDGTFTPKDLPSLVQTTSIRSILSDDINQDGYLDLTLFGNKYDFEVETPRQDAGYGFYLAGDGQGNFVPTMPYQSGLYAKGNVAQANMISIGDQQQAILIAKNKDFLQLVKINEETEKKQLEQF